MTDVDMYRVYVCIMWLVWNSLHSFIGSGAGSVTVELSVEVSVTDVVLTRLTPGANYILSVTAENAVSSQDTTSRNVISISARTAEGGIVFYWRGCMSYS